MILQNLIKEMPCGALEESEKALLGGKSAVVCGVNGSLVSALSSRLYIDTNRQVLLVIRKQSDLEKLEGDLKSFLGDEAVYTFPAYDTIPYERRKPHGRVIEERMRTLFALASGKKGVTVVSLQTLLFRIPPPSYMVNNTLELRTGEEMDLGLVAEWLTEMGFTRTAMIDDMGQFSIRGGILDVFPFLCENPFRLEFWGDTIESIRSFDVFTQRSLEKVKSVTVIPMREIVHKAKAGVPVEEEGIEWRLAEYIDKDVSLLDYLRPDSFVVLDESSVIDATWSDALALLQSARSKEDDLPPEKLLTNRTVFNLALSKFAKLTIQPFKSDGCIDFNSQSQPIYNRQGSGYFEEFKALEEKGYKIVVACENGGQEKRFRELAVEAGVEIGTAIGALEEGFVLDNEKFALFSENRLLNRYQGRVRFRRYKGGTTLHHISSLKVGDIVVHVDHGIGRFLGLERIKVGRLEKDCIKIEYKDKATLSVPIENLNKVSKYSAGEDAVAPELTALGGRAWDKAKSKAKEELNKVVSGLVQVYAQRQFGRGFQYEEDSSMQSEFEESFIYEDTPDQARVTEEIKSDLRREQPMDRLLCGDAGFGKTEVALRAAFKITETGRQVAVLVPTTLLAFQHFQSFSERFRDYPMKIGMVSRFSTPKEAALTLAQAKSGDVDIMIGTHRLLSRDIGFKSLGLLVIDEEHKFGVKHKEKLKELKAQVDVLSMTATPIPRTLQFSLLGVRDMSLISTPPRNRLPIHTRVLEEDKNAIREAILREKARGGQIFFLHNRVQTIDRAADELREAVSGVTFAVAHGQMDEGEMESVMMDFIKRKIDVLVCSTIVESGIDIPNANTIIVRDADHLGLSQLYQLRGRVGRSSIQAYALLMVESYARMTGEGKARLKALEQLTEFGSGFQVSMRDLEIRGAGNMLGVKQHGLMCQVGFEMYSELLNEAVLEVKENRKVTRTDPLVKMEARAFIPGEYIEETGQRLAIYHRLSRAKSIAEIDDMRDELNDRFGAVPESVEALINVIVVKFVASRIEASGVSIRVGRVIVEFDSTEYLSTERLAALLDKLPSRTAIRYEKPFALDIPTEGSDELAGARKVLQVIIS
jgi:transcription-repair coupling factor (superfamily II helicase)